MSGYKLRSLCPGDLERVARIQSTTTGVPRKGFFEKLLMLVMANPKGFLNCGVEEGGLLQGFAFARIQEGEFGTLKKVAVLDILGVAPESQRRGIGKTAVSGIEQQLKSKGIITLKTQIDWTDRALTGFFSSAGFKLAHSQVLERDTSPLCGSPDTGGREEGTREHRTACGKYYDAYVSERLLVRSFRKEDLSAVVRIDSRHTGLDRSAYFAAKAREMLEESGVRISLVAEDHGVVTGFIMARVDFGEFGRLESQAVIDTIGVHPAYAGNGIGRSLLSQLLVNLSTLRVDSVRSQVSWENFQLQNFLHRRGFARSQRLILKKGVGSLLIGPWPGSSSLAPRC